MLPASLPRAFRAAAAQAAGAALLCLSLAACGGAAPARLNGPRPAAPAPDAKAVAPLPEAQLPGPSGLPALGTLTAPERSLSSSAYGFQPQPPSGYVSGAGATANPDDSATLQPLGSAPAFAIYGLGGFTNGAYPVSAKLTFAAPVAQCYVAFPDYAAGRWRVEGPFTDSVEVPIVLRGQDLGYLSFVSPAKSAYFAVLFPAGDPGGTLTEVSFGVNGGDTAPQAPLVYNVDSGDLGVVLQWYDTPDEAAPDFAGYVVERAPQFSGSFAPLATDPSRWHDYFDSTTEAAKLYRYRIAAFDLSGNVSRSNPLTAGEAAGTQLDPVARVTYTPTGPYSAPALISYDLSASYDPEGEALFGHEILAPLIPGVLASGETGSFTLQPGAFLCQAIVHAGTRTGDASDWLTAVPQWEAASHVLRPSDPATTVLYRLVLSAPFLLPGDPDPWVVGYDIAANGVTFVRSEGGSPVFHRVGLTNFIAGLSRPVIADGACWIAATDGNSATCILRFDGTTAQITRAIDSSEYASDCWLAETNDDSVRVFYTNSFNGTDFSLATTHAGTGAGAAIFSTGANVSSKLRAIYNPGADRYDIFYITNTNHTQWFRWDANTNTLGANQLISAAAATDIAPAIDPVTGETTVAVCVGTNWVWSHYDGVAWAAGETINATPADQPGQLAFQDNQPFLLASKATGQTTLYQRTGPATWVERNTPIPATDGGRSCGLVAGTQPGQLYGTDAIKVGTSAQTRLFLFDPADNDTTLLNLPGVNWPALNYAAASGSDGLHVVMATNFIGAVEHWRSPDAAAWTSAVVPYTLNNVRLAANQAGEIYLGAFNTTSSDARLYWWDSAGTTWTAEPTSLATTSSSSVALLGSYGTANVTLSAFDSGTMELHKSAGTHTAPYATSNFATPVTLWRGILSQAGWFGSAGGATEQAGQVSFLNSSGVDQIYDPLPESSFRFLSQIMVNNYSYQWGYSTTRGDGSFGPVDQKIYYGATHGQLLNPARFAYTLFGPGGLEMLPFGDTEFANFPEGGEYRRTISMATSRSSNALSLIANLDGSVTRFEWTDAYGWQSLPLPPDMGRMMAPLIVAGYDGRWHIIYYDWETDAVMIRSTL